MAPDMARTRTRDCAGHPIRAARAARPQRGDALRHVVGRARARADTSDRSRPHDRRDAQASDIASGMASASVDGARFTSASASAVSAALRRSRQPDEASRQSRVTPLAPATPDDTLPARCCDRRGRCSSPLPCRRCHCRACRTGSLSIVIGLWLGSAMVGLAQLAYSVQAVRRLKAVVPADGDAARIGFADVVGGAASGTGGAGARVGSRADGRGARTDPACHRRAARRGRGADASRDRSGRPSRIRARAALRRLDETAAGADRRLRRLAPRGAPDDARDRLRARSRVRRLRGRRHRRAARLRTLPHESDRNDARFLARPRRRPSRLLIGQSCDDAHRAAAGSEASIGPARGDAGDGRQRHARGARLLHGARTSDRHRSSSRFASADAWRRDARIRRGHRGALRRYR